MENFGAAIALIADTKTEDMEDVVMMDYGGNGHSLVTPGFMIDHESSNEIKRFIKNGREVVIRASLRIANNDNEIEIGLLYSSSLDLDSQSLNSFAQLALNSAVTR